MSGIKLKPCPFCGCESIGISISAENYEGSHGGGWIITTRGFCRECGATGKTFETYLDRDMKAEE